jgi:hypothetical protein
MYIILWVCHKVTREQQQRAHNTYARSVLTSARPSAPSGVARVATICAVCDTSANVTQRYEDLNAELSACDTLHVVLGCHTPVAAAAVDFTLPLPLPQFVTLHHLR